MTENDKFYTSEYFDVQVAFASKWVSLIGAKNSELLPTLLEKKTSLQRAFFYQREPIASEKSWQEAVQEAKQADEGWQAFSSTLYRYYIDLMNSTEVIEEEHENGNLCVFSEYKADEDLLKTHYAPMRVNGSSVLSRANRTLRFDHYTQLFKKLAKQFDWERMVTGNSWMYNMESYNWLYPANKKYFTDTGEKRDSALQVPPLGSRMFVPEDSRYSEKILPPNLKSWSTWGQFLTGSFQTHLEYARLFLQGVEKARTLEELFDAFPLPERQYTTSLQSWLTSLHLEDQHD